MRAAFFFWRVALMFWDRLLRRVLSGFSFEMLFHTRFLWIVIVGSLVFEREAMIMVGEDPVVELVRKQKRNEEAMVKVVEDLEGKVNSEAAKLVLAELRLDSTKHARICEEILKIAEKVKPDLLWNARIDSYVDMQMMKKELERHIKLEDSMLKDVEKVIVTTKDEALKLMFTHIAEDEKKHHKNVELVIKKSYMLNP
jgi:hypothetical protein